MTVVLPDVDHVCRFAVSGSTNGVPFTNIFHVQYAGAVLDAASLNSACTAVLAAYNNTFTPIICNTVVTSSCAGQDLTSRTGAVGTGGVSGTGGILTSPTPNNVALCVSWIISDRYRGGHPRSYLPGIPLTDVTNGRLLTTTAHQSFQNAAAGFLTDINAMTAGSRTWTMVCVRYFSQHQLLGTPYVRPISSSAVHQRTDSMRRRLGKEVA